MTAWAQGAGIVLLAVTAWTAPGGGGTATPDGPPALAQTSAALSAPKIAQPRVDVESVLSDGPDAHGPGAREIGTAERGLATTGSFVAKPRRPEPGSRVAMEPGDDALASEAPVPDGVAPEPGAVAEGPLRLQDTEVTVLLWLAPGSYGIRRGYRTADPVLCVADGCYVSRGPERPARFLPGRRALGFFNTWGERAGACRDALMCVFRRVDLGRLPGYLQPVDLHILRHDRRRGARIGADSNCRLELGRLR